MRYNHPYLCFPDGSYGSKGFKKNILQKKEVIKKLKKFCIKPQVKDGIL